MAALNIHANAIFYDDDPVNIKDVSEKCNQNVVSVLIPTTKSLPDINAETNVYLLLRNKLEYLPKFDPVSGIQKEQAEQLQTWAETRKGPKHVFFDWDFTLSMHNGVLIPDIPHGASISSAYELHLGKRYTEERIYNDMLIYLMGGEERLKMLRKMFSVLKQNSVKVSILTNNPACYMPYWSGVFRTLVYKLAGHKMIKFICSHGEPFNNDKGVAILVKERSTCKRCSMKCRKKTRKNKSKK